MLNRIHAVVPLSLLVLGRGIGAIYNYILFPIVYTKRKLNTTEFRNFLQIGMLQ